MAKKLAVEIDSMSFHGFQYWPVFALATGEFAGCAGLRPYKLEEKIYDWDSIFVRSSGGRVWPKKQGARSSPSHSNTIQARSLFAGHRPANAASRRVLEKLGFRFTHEELYPPTGLQHPSYSLLPKKPGL